MTFIVNVFSKGGMAVVPDRPMRLVARPIRFVARWVRVRKRGARFIPRVVPWATFRIPVLVLLVNRLVPQDMALIRLRIPPLMALMILAVPTWVPLRVVLAVRSICALILVCSLLADGTGRPMATDTSTMMNLITMNSRLTVREVFSGF